LDKKVTERIAEAVKKAAIDSGVIRKKWKPRIKKQRKH
jgi:malic enzyme